MQLINIHISNRLYNVYQSLVIHNFNYIVHHMHIVGKAEKNQVAQRSYFKEFEASFILCSFSE